MKYENIVQGTFVSRPNRFIANVIIDGKEEKVHVKNTGRCRELLAEQAKVYLEKAKDPSRKTQYSLIGVEKKGRMVNMDSQAPNKAVDEWLQKGNLFGDNCKIQREKTYGDSRLDFYIEQNERKIWMEVKGVTLEKDNVVSFPDAPTQRGIKHLKELCKAVKNGYEACVFFVIQMKDVEYFTPNGINHPEFEKELWLAHQMGVKIYAYDCEVSMNEMIIKDEVKIVFRKGIKEDFLRTINEPLLKWFDSNARVLPWRSDPAPYRVWISEIMLQQTRVEAVKPYFERFIKAFPSIYDLAKAKDEELLKLWEGLGYYNRAANLKKAAQEVIREHNGYLPKDYEELIKLPGIGSYTAGAISSIAFQRPVPAVDGNVLRVISRYIGSKDDILNTKVKREMEQILIQVMPKDRPGDFNQALMEIGAMVCIPNGQPKCPICPLAKECRAVIYDLTDEIPVKKAKKPRIIQDRTIVILRTTDKILLQKRPGKGLLAGMYEFINVEGTLSQKEVLLLVKKMDLSPIRIKELERSKHIFSHIEWHMTGFEVIIDDTVDGWEQNVKTEEVFAFKNEIRDKYPIPTALNTYVKWVLKG